MAYVLILLTLIVPVTSVVGAVLGWKALDADPPSTSRLRRAAWWLAIPWLGYVILAGPPGMAEGLSFVFPPLVAAALMAGWWWRSRFASTAPPVEAMASASRENPPADSTRVGGHSRGALSDLRLPRLTQVVIALAVTMPVLWLLSRPRRGFSGPDMGTIALEALLTWATLFGAAVAVVLAVIHIVRPAAALAAVYSTLALCVILGHGSLLVLGYWQNVPERDGHYSLSVAVPLVFASVAALIPAVIAGMVNRRAN